MLFELADATFHGMTQPVQLLRGYASETLIHSIAEEVQHSNKPVFIYNLGDHDPSGPDAWRAFRQGVIEFLGGKTWTYSKTGVLRPLVERSRPLDLPRDRCARRV